MRRITLATILMLSFLFANSQNVAIRNLRSGDLIFVGAEKDNLSGAINRVTQKKDSIAFDHIGIVEKKGDAIFVLHASSKQGSVEENIREFYRTEKTADNKIMVYRLKDSFQHAIPAALVAARQMLGKPYNWTYILSENSYYCSDFIERSFRKDHIFALEPMTFINPKTGEIDDFWIDFYKKQHLDVPEGKPGCNPNGLAASDKLVLLGNLIN